ncbi:hypothetical protein AAMO2058_000483200 [Amorphochlora amoebiformis]|eukprot:1376253-Amorphochlora_amoeboformis.AAC.1
MVHAAAWLTSLATLVGALMDKTVIQELEIGKYMDEPEIIRLLSGAPVCGNVQIWAYEPVYLPSAEYIAEVRNASDPGLDRFYWDLQHTEKDHEVEHMTIFPIGKHISSLALDLYYNLPKPTMLEAGNIEYHSELKSLPHKVKTTPWLWSRIQRCQLDRMSDGGDELQKSWGCYFKLLKNRERPSASPLAKRIAGLINSFVAAGKHRFKLEEGVRPTEHEARQFYASQYVSAQAHRYLFTLNEETQRQVEKVQRLVNWPEPEEKAVVASVHIRRGDLAGFNCSHHQSKRLCTYTHVQVERVRLMRLLYGVTHVYVMTEELREVELARKLAPEFHWISLVEVYQAPIKQPLASRQKNGVEWNVEMYLHMKSEEKNFDGKIIEDHVYGYLADMKLAARADVHVLEDSCTSMSMLAISHGNKGYMPPHVPSNNHNLLWKPYWCSMKDSFNSEKYKKF